MERMESSPMLRKQGGTVSNPSTSTNSFDDLQVVRITTVSDRRQISLCLPRLPSVCYNTYNNYAVEREAP